MSHRDYLGTRVFSSLDGLRALLLLQSFGITRVPAIHIPSVFSAATLASIFRNFPLLSGSTRG
jgi:hypothetical protein